VSSLAGEGRLISFPEDHPDSARLRLAQALRPLIAMTVSGTLDDVALEEAADVVERVGADLAARAGSDRRMRQEPDTGRPTIDYLLRRRFATLPGHGPAPARRCERRETRIFARPGEPNEGSTLLTSPLAGILNPIAPPVRLVVVDGEASGNAEIRGTVWFDYPYEGPPNCVHGGVIAATFDEILGAANIVAGSPGMTGTLSVRYRKPTPLRVELRLEARFLDRSGRKIRTWAGMYHGDVLTAEADGLFIEVIPRQMLAIAEQNAEGPDDGLLRAMRQTVDTIDPLADPGAG
jgi:acyl-coenzyme A thioesterase PaaI-like protein